MPTRTVADDDPSPDLSIATYRRRYTTAITSVARVLGQPARTAAAAVRPKLNR